MNQLLDQFKHGTFLKLQMKVDKKLSKGFFGHKIEFWHFMIVCF